MRFTSLASALAFGALLQGCAVQAPPIPVAAPAALSADCTQSFEDRMSEVDKRHRNLLIALNDGQVDQAMAMYAQKFIAVTPGISESAPFQGPAWMREYLQEQVVAKGVRFDIDGYVAGVSDHCDVRALGGQYRLILNGERHLRPYLIVWRRMNSDWFVIAHHVDLASGAPQQTSSSSVR